jgi:CDP-diacylglycerol--serine O-phosphatidyltransferase
MTTISLYCGFTSILASIGKEFDNAAWFILAAILFDMLDGTVARLTKSTSEFGKELDSLADIVSFGVAPAVLVFVSYLPGPGGLPVLAETGTIIGRAGSFIAIVYVIGVALRLARYNVYQADRRDIFTGLPCPAAGGLIASFILFMNYFEPRLESLELGPIGYYALGSTTVALSLLMLSTISYAKNPVKALILNPRNAFATLSGCILIILAIHFAISRSPALVLFPLGATYVLYGLFAATYRRFIRPGLRTHRPAHPRRRNDTRKNSRNRRRFLPRKKARTTIKFHPFTHQHL